eukprot:TRINITY_DN42225_c0_g1_i1.p1 TRINITY_DN42225_c0_g1~~TRINITY_DN42225_c0_g1_i1.p1  ORF type:complete len:436 (-),score=54.26 TRINITY_DN42225_c0_g1_i1:224-1495(-)
MALASALHLDSRLRESFLRATAAVVIGLGGIHTFCRLHSKKGKVAAPTSPSSLPNAPQKPLPPVADTVTVLVTGGSGLVGARIVDFLTRKQTGSGSARYRVVSADLHQPAPNTSRHVDNVTYETCNLGSMTVLEMEELLDRHKVNIVCHTAGIVLMKDDPAPIFNVNLFAAQKLLLAAKNALAVVGFLITSSTSVINTGQQDNVHMEPSLRAARTRQSFSTDYGYTKAQAENSVLDANDPTSNFFTTALRLPGVYGSEDPWLGGPLLRGELTVIPGNPSKHIEMVYVENVAHAHACAIDKLAAGNCDVSGRAFHITNHQPEITMGQFVQTATAIIPQKKEPRPLPYLLGLLTCCFSEFWWFFTQGNVFMPQHPIWNFTRSSFGYMNHDGSFSTTGNQDLLGYMPVYDVKGSFEHMKKLASQPK